MSTDTPDMEVNDPVQEQRRRLDALRTDLDGPGWAAAQALARRIMSVTQREHRPATIRSAFKQLDDESLLAALDISVREARQGQRAYRAVLQELALDPTLLTGLDYDRVQRLYEIVSTHDLQDIRSLFLSADTRHTPESHGENDHLSLPLGVRRAAARTRDRNLIDRLLRDRNPLVIRRLLDNPRLIERNVVDISALRPTNPEVLRAVAEHTRWSSRYAVRKALACNPYTPTPIALNLLSTLMLQDLRFIARNGVLPSELRGEANRLYQRRLDLQTL